MVARMTDHAAIGREVAARIAAEVRAELARQRKTQGDLATALGLTPHTIGRRLSGDVPFSAAEVAVAAKWLGVDVAGLVGDNKRAAS